jgi:hypothetical protein
MTKANATNLDVKCSLGDGYGRAAVLLRNRSEGDLLVLVSGPGIDYSLRMTTEEGHPVPYTEFGRQTQLPSSDDGKLHPLSFSTQDVTLRPGEERTEKILLEDFFVLPAEGGTFKLEISRKLRYDDEKTVRTLSCKPMTLHLPPSKK